MLLALGGCTYEVGFQPDYVPPERPPYIAQGKILVVVPKNQEDFVYEGGPASRVGDFTKMSIPIGQIFRDISDEVFSSCFSQGVVFANDRSSEDDYVIAVEANLQSFLYRYGEVIDTGFSDEQADTWIVPQVEIALDVSAYNARDELLLRDTYESGIVAGEGYRTATRPAERVNETLHATLHRLMLRVADDLRPLLIGECEVEDLAAGS